MEIRRSQSRSDTKKQQSECEKKMHREEEYELNELLQKNKYEERPAPVDFETSVILEESYEKLKQVISTIYF